MAENFAHQRVIHFVVMNVTRLLKLLKCHNVFLQHFRVHLRLHKK